MAADWSSPTAARPVITRDVTQGALRLLLGLDLACVTEFPLKSGRRIDIMGLTPDGEFWAIEVKSGEADYRADAKWGEYLDYCDRFFFAVAEDFPLTLRKGLIETAPAVGHIVADRFGGAVVREARHHRLAPARRKALTLSFARVAARRPFAELEGFSANFNEG